ncbi:cellulase family glycosylhydrolase [Maribellus maritimus]|uniref:cellulase family glycosylhydrolase n=1 Tax=Maribellus maritimus TaxID=2870838 RepID=UPI001EEC7DF6|nr:cellulase family glycosylhydrolase [Maribellus maritimus]MCG6186154.1 cellulase family glycosylhydrolase [Maribellus maritimus]
MKKNLIIIVLLLLFFVFGCDKKKEEIIPPEEFVAELSVAPLSFDFTKEGGTKTFSIASNTTWNINSSSTWCRPSIQTTKGNASVTITADANELEEERNTTFTITALNVDDITISISQEAGEPEIHLPEYIEPDNTGMESDAKTIASKIYLGWNLGNTLEAIGGETVWGNPQASADLILAVKAAGFNAVRIPCSWDQYLEEQTTYKIQESWLTRVKEVVDYCIENDMFAILNIHWDGGWMENNCTPEKQNEVNQKLETIWKQIAIYFRDYDEHLLFAGANEPNAENQVQVDVLAAYMQTFVDIVRATGGKNAYRNLVVQTPFTDIDKADTYMTIPSDNTDNRLLAEVHYYTPWQFCGLTEDAGWGDVYYFWGAPYHLEGAEGRYPDWNCEEDYLVAQFQKMKTKFVDNGIPVILGEFGAIHRTFPYNQLWQEKHDESLAYFYKNVVEKAKNNGLVPFFWDNGSGIFNRETNLISDQQSYTGLIEGASAGIYPF